MTRVAFERVLAMRGGRVSGWLIAATAAHVALAFVLARDASAARPAPPPAIEVDLVQEPPPLPAREPEPPKPTPDEQPSAPATPAPLKPIVNAAPAPAKAGAVLVAKEEAPTPKGEEPVSFVTDENGGEYGSGVVAKGGTAAVGLPGAKSPVAAPVASAAPAAAPKPFVEAPVANLSRKPSLDVPDACKGYFPASAEDDHALVTLRVIVRATGAVEGATVIAETPKGQGFGAAARTCLLARTFTAGLDEAGRPATAQTTVNVRFNR
ncbi:MAG: hypothetical protein HYV09_38820 [Deltaproteobacteria bacterium]|nr:hypothetical protein [Deltaproteobacteria bacterium]